MSVLVDLDRFDHGGFVHADLNSVHYYCMIPKNASSWISGVLAASGWRPKRIEDIFAMDPDWVTNGRARTHHARPEIDNLIVVLRDPVERWIAGISQYLATSVLHSHWYDRRQWPSGYDGRHILGKDNFVGPIFSAPDFIKNYNEITERLMFDQVTFDDHTLPQTWFVSHFQYVKQHTWFYLNADFTHNFRTELQLLINTSAEADHNQGADQPDIAQLENFFRQRITERPYLRRQLERYYQEDYDLIRQVFFVHHAIPQDGQDGD